MAKFPQDRFDGVPDSLLRVGAHRSGVRRHGGLIVFAWAFLAVGVLTAGGIAWLTVTNDSFQFRSSASTSSSSATPKSTATGTATSGATKTPAATPTATPLADPSKVDSTKTTITVLNATTTTGLASTAGTTLTNAGWVVGNMGNASSQVSTSVVYYDDSAADNESIALGIAKSLGINTVEQSTAFPGATITVILGADFNAQS